MAEKLPELPVFRIPEPVDPASWRLVVDGLVAEPRSFSLPELNALAEGRIDGDFSCEEGWYVADLHWHGVLLSSILLAVQPLESARFVAVGAEGFVTVMPLGDVETTNALLATELDGEPLAWEHGGPLRLTASEAACYQSVKWVDRITLAESDEGDTARSIAMSRTRRPRPAV